MKSSSDIFPVRLLRADIWDDLAEDIYLIKHNRDKDQTVEVAVSRLGMADQTVAPGYPVVLVHGSFTNKSFWLSQKGKGLARYLVEAGYDVWMMEMRGHGHSPHNRNYQSNTVEGYAAIDLPAVHEFIHEKTGASPIWVGHSLGGTAIATALALNSFRRAPRAAVLLGTQVVRRLWYLQIPTVPFVLKLAVSLKKGLDGRAMNMGPEHEPAGVIKEYIRRHSLLGRWKAPVSKQDLYIGWRSASVPLLGVSASHDARDPDKHCQKFYQLYGGPKQLMTLGKKQGLSRDYGHVDMIVSKDAETEVWPLLSQWLKAYVSR